MLPSDEPPPWSIPVREPDADIVQRSATWIDRVPVLPMAAAAIVLFAVVVAALVVLDGDPAQSGPEVLGSAVGPDTTIAPTPSVEPQAESSTSSSTTVVDATTTLPPTTTVAPEAAPAPPPDPEPSDLPIHTPGDLGPGWVAQVSSVPSSAGGSALSRSHDTISRSVPDAIIVRGSDWASLRDGFWVIVRAGYDDASTAVSDCDRWGLDGRDECFARWLSPNDETQRVCWRDESGALAGDCT